MATVKKDQATKKDIIKAIGIFMAFALFIAMGALASEDSIQTQFRGDKPHETTQDVK